MKKIMILFIVCFVAWLGTSAQSSYYQNSNFIFLQFLTSNTRWVKGNIERIEYGFTQSNVYCSTQDGGNWYLFLYKGGIIMRIMPIEQCGIQAYSGGNTLNYLVDSTLPSGNDYSLQFIYDHRPFDNYQRRFYALQTHQFAIGDAPDIIYPQSNQQDLELSFTIDWKDIPSADHYRITIGEWGNPNFWVSCTNGSQNAVIDVDNIIQSEFTLPPGLLQYDTTYQLSVKAYQGGGCFNSYFLFSTKDSTLAFGPMMAGFTATQTQLCTGESTTFQGFTSGGTAQQWVWQISPSSHAFINGTAPNSQFPEVLFLAQGDYDVRLIVDNGFYQDTAFYPNHIKVRQSPIISLGSDFYGCQSTTLDPGPGFVDYAWSNGDSNRTTTVFKNGDYSVTVTDVHGCQGSDTITAVDPGPGNNWQPVTYTQSTVLFGVVFIDCKRADVGDKVAAFVNGQCRGVSTLQPNHIIGDTAYVTLLVNGTAAPETVTFKLWDASECDSIVLDLSITSMPGGNIGWPPNYLVFGEPFEEIVVTPGNQVQFCSGDTINLSTISTGTLLWSNNSNGQSASITSGGNYWVKDTTLSCKRSDTIYVQENDLQILNIGDSLFYCGAAIIDAGSGWDSVHWFDGRTINPLPLSSSGMVTVEAFDSNGCRATDTMMAIREDMGSFNTFFNWQNARIYGSPKNEEVAEIVYANESLYLSGWNYYQLPVGCGEIPQSSHFLIKHNLEGDPIWSIPVGSYSYPKNHIVADPEGYLYNAFNKNHLVKYDESGNVVWEKEWQNYNIIIENLHVDASYVYLTGYYTGNIVINGSFYRDLSGKINSSNFLLIKLDKADGQVLWVQNGGGIVRGMDVTTDNMGNIFVTGFFYDGGSVAGYSMTDFRYNTPEGFVAKIDKNGNGVWARSLAKNSNVSQGRALTVDNNGGVYIASLSSNIYMLKFDANSGSQLWYALTPTNSSTGVYDINYDPLSQQIVFTGSYRANSNNITKLLIGKIDANGNLRAFRTGGGYWTNQGEYGQALALDHYGNIYATGPSSSRWADFGSYRINHTQPLTSQNAIDYLIVKAGNTLTCPPNPTNLLPTSLTMCAGDSVLIEAAPGFGSYYWPYSCEEGSSIWATAPGVYKVIGRSCDGCTYEDSVVVNQTNTATTQILTNRDPHFCKGDSVVLSTVAKGSFQWFPTGDTTEMITIAYTDTFSAIVTNLLGCTYSSDTVLTQKDSVSSPVISSNSPVHVSDTLQLTNTVVIGGTHHWSGPNGFEDTLNDPVRLNMQLMDSGLYHLVVQEGICSSDTVSTFVSMYDTNQVLTVMIDTVVGISGYQVVVPIRVLGWDSIRTSQFTVAFDASRLTYQGVEQLNLPNLTQASFGTAYTNVGILTFSWYDLGIQFHSMADSAVIFAIRFDVTGAPGEAAFVSYTQSPTPFEFIKDMNTLEPLPFDTTSGLVNIKEMVQISGNVHTEIGTPVRSVSLDVSGQLVDTFFTNIAGNYKLISLAENYLTLKAFKDNDTTTYNGITTADLIPIQKHILGTELLNSPYKLIAADVNGDQQITTADMQLIQQVILQQQTHFPGSRLWHFVADDYVFSNPQNPWPFRNFHHIPTAVNQGGYDFVGCKLGDVTESYDPTVPKDGERLLRIILPDIEVSPGGVIAVPVVAEGFDSVSGFQWGHGWDEEVLELAALEPASLPGHIAFAQATSGNLQLSWFEPAGKTYTCQDGDTLFHIFFNVIGTPGANTDLSIDAGSMPIEAYNASLERFTIAYNTGMVLISMPLSVAEADVGSVKEGFSFVLRPNPGRDFVDMELYIAEREDIKIQVYNLLGVQVDQFQLEQVQGLQTVRWESFDAVGAPLPNGVYWVQVKTEQAHVLGVKPVIIQR